MAFWHERSRGGRSPWLGGISYSFYLVHSLALVFVINLITRLPSVALPSWLQAVLFLVAGFAAATFLAAIFFALAERFYFHLEAGRPAPGMQTVDLNAASS